MSPASRGVAALLIAAGVVIFGSSPAHAHATLVSSDPGAGAVLDRSPRMIELQFSEPVTFQLGAVRLYGADGVQIRPARLERYTSSRVRAVLPEELADGAYVVTWRVTSADTHPVQGAFTFQVGAAPSTSGRTIDTLADRLLADQRGSGLVGVLWGVTRWLAFVGIALLIGAVHFGVVIGTTARDMPVTRRIVTVAWVVVFVATVIGFALQGPYTSGLGIGKVFDPSFWVHEAGTRFGIVWLGRLGLLMVAFGLLRWWFRHRPATEHPEPTWWLASAVIVGLGIVSTPALAGHAAAGDLQVLAALASTVHVAAVSVWLGGLVVLGAAVVRGSDIEDARTVVTRFSRVALWCVLAIVATGAFQTWRQVRELSAFGDSDFGHVLMIKLMVFAVMMVFAAFSRDLVARLFGSRSPGRTLVVSGAAVTTRDPGPREEPTPEEVMAERRREWRSLRRSVGGEAVCGLAVLAVAAVLMNTVPPSAGTSPTADGAAVTLRSHQLVVDISMSPGVAGRNDVHVSTFGRAGALVDVAELAVVVDLPSKQIAPISVPLRRLGPGHYLAPGFTVPFPGEWRMMAKARLTEIDLVTLTGTITVR